MRARPFRFGVVFTSATDRGRWRDLARRLEAEGCSTLLVADHYDNPMSCGALLVAAADATTTPRIGSYVYNNDHSHPALLAKEAATIDVLSDGRLEFGVGAGWAKSEYDEVGLAFDPGPVRGSRFEEGIEVMARLFDGGPVDFDGQHDMIRGLEGTPASNPAAAATADRRRWAADARDRGSPSPGWVVDRQGRLMALPYDPRRGPVPPRGTRSRTARPRRRQGRWRLAEQRMARVL